MFTYKTPRQTALVATHFWAPPVTQELFLNKPLLLVTSSVLLSILQLPRDTNSAHLTLDQLRVKCL